MDIQVVMTDIGFMGGEPRLKDSIRELGIHSVCFSLEYFTQWLEFKDSIRALVLFGNPGQDTEKKLLGSQNFLNYVAAGRPVLGIGPGVYNLMCGIANVEVEYFESWKVSSIFAKRGGIWCFDHSILDRRVLQDFLTFAGCEPDL